MLLDQFDKKAYIESATGIPQDGNNFFNQYITHIQNPWDMISIGQLLLHKCYDTDPVAYSRIYKGEIYFYLGLASFRLQDYEVALFFIDNAVFSDVQAKIDSINSPSHAMRFIQLDSSLPEHKDFIGDTETRTNDVIRIYNSRTGSQNLKMSDLRDRFLQPSMTRIHPNWRTLATTFVSFCLEWNYRDELFTICSDQSTSEPYFLHLFKGCLLFESLLKNNLKYPHPSTNTISTLEQELNRLQQPLGFTDKKKLKIGGMTLNQVLSKLNQETDKSLQATSNTLDGLGILSDTILDGEYLSIKMNINNYFKWFQVRAFTLFQRHINFNCRVIHTFVTNNTN